MGYNRIFWKDRIVVNNQDGTVNKVIQEGTPVSAFNLNNMDEGIFRIDAFMEMIRKNTSVHRLIGMEILVIFILFHFLLQRNLLVMQKKLLSRIQTEQIFG